MSDAPPATPGSLALAAATRMLRNSTVLADLSGNALHASPAPQVAAQKTPQQVLQECLGVIEDGQLPEGQYLELCRELKGLFTKVTASSWNPRIARHPIFINLRFDEVPQIGISCKMTFKAIIWKVGDSGNFKVLYDLEYEDRSGTPTERKDQTINLYKCEEVINKWLRICRPQRVIIGIDGMRLDWEAKNILRYEMAEDALAERLIRDDGSERSDRSLTGDYEYNLGGFYSYVQIYVKNIITAEKDCIYTPDYN